MFIPFTDKEEAYYLAGLLNSSLIRLLVGSYTIETAMGTHIMAHLKIPKFDVSNPLHARITDLSKDAHERRGSLSVIEEELDQKIAELYGLSQEDSDNVKVSLGLITIVSEEPEEQP